MVGDRLRVTGIACLGGPLAWRGARLSLRLRQVALGPLGDDRLVITGGLRAGERVVTSGADRLRDGMRVSVQPAVRG